MEINKEYLDVFLEEADELLKSLENKDLRSNLEDYRRVAHTIKSSSKIMSLNNISETARIIEYLLKKVINNEITLDDKLKESIMKSFDILRKNIEHVRKKEKDVSSDNLNDETIKQFKTLIGE